MNEFTASNGLKVTRRRGYRGVSIDDVGVSDSEIVALTEFLEHEKNHKPWHDAKEGEVWELTFSEEGGGGTEAWTVDRQDCFVNPFYVSKVTREDSTIIAGRRIYPEGE